MKKKIKHCSVGNVSENWILVVDGYNNPVEKRAVDLLISGFGEYFGVIIPAFALSDVMNYEIYEIRDKNIVTLGFRTSNRLIEKCFDNGIMEASGGVEGYSVYVGESVLRNDKQMIVIAGSDYNGLLYGVMDFRNRYLGKEIFYVDDHNDMFNEKYFSNIFKNPIKEWRACENPVIPTRAIWTWGHVIYDYRAFFENMAKIRLNEIVIWNDFPPVNADKIVECAHSYGIKVIWGFSWGWGLNCVAELEKLDTGALLNLKKSIIAVYTDGYANTGADGIYFQSFTEMKQSTVGDKCVAEIVTHLVNDVANELLRLYPDLHIQFGLHATSVMDDLDYLKLLDTRVRIVWEDCGAFPYAYKGLQTENFENTRDFLRNLMDLRTGSEKIGVVFKGMVNLDWQSFSHATESLNIGENEKSFIEERSRQKSFLWKLVQANWLKNSEYARTAVMDIANGAREPIVQALVEDGMFECDIFFPVALYADLLWCPCRPIDEIIESVAKYPCVKFANFQSFKGEKLCSLQ